jgi:hypothetical protein
MAVVTVTRWKTSMDQALPLAREAAPILKSKGATAVRFGPCFAGGDAGQIYVAISYPDWETFGRAQQALAADEQWQRLYAQAVKLGEVQNRSIVVAEEL